MKQIIIDENNIVIGYSDGNGYIENGILVDYYPDEFTKDFEYGKYLYINGEFIYNSNYNLIELSNCKTSKITEMDNACKQTIYNGLDITLEDGTIEHFTLDEQDQLNLSGIGLKLLMGAETVAWHEDDETVPCRFYSAADATKIISTLTAWKEYHITYFRDLRIYINSLTTVEEIELIEYGFVLPEEFKSEVLITYEQQLGMNINE